MKIGVQLYTIQDYVQNLKDFSESLKKVADMGYTTVQISGTCDFEPEWLAQELDKNHLTCDLTNVPIARLIGEPEKVIQELDVYNCKNVGIYGYDPFRENNDPEMVKEFEEKARGFVDCIKKSGKKFFYHNHAHEFNVINGSCIFEKLVEAFTPEEMGFMLDVYWVKEAGHDPAKLLRELKGRVECIHFKDMAIGADQSHKYQWIGGGILDFDDIILACQQAGVEYAYVEQDDCYGQDPFECLKKSYDFLSSKGLK